VIALEYPKPIQPYSRDHLLVELLADPAEQDIRLLPDIQADLPAVRDALRSLYRTTWRPS
jgi:hypothetical protein